MTTSHCNTSRIDLYNIRIYAQISMHNLHNKQAHWQYTSSRLHATVKQNKINTNIYKQEWITETGKQELQTRSGV